MQQLFLMEMVREMGSGEKLIYLVICPKNMTSQFSLLYDRINKHFQYSLKSNRAPYEYLLKNG